MTSECYLIFSYIKAMFYGFRGKRTLHNLCNLIKYMLTIKAKSFVNAIAQDIVNSITITLKVPPYHFAPSYSNTKPETQREITACHREYPSRHLQPLWETN